MLEQTATLLVQRIDNPLQLSRGFIYIVRYHRLRLRRYASSVRLLQQNAQRVVVLRGNGLLHHRNLHHQLIVNHAIHAHLAVRLFRDVAQSLEQLGQVRQRRLLHLLNRLFPANRHLPMKRPLHSQIERQIAADQRQGGQEERGITSHLQAMSPTHITIITTYRLQHLVRHPVDLVRLLQRRENALLVPLQVALRVLLHGVGDRRIQRLQLLVLSYKRVLGERLLDEAGLDVAQREHELEEDLEGKLGVSGKEWRYFGDGLSGLVDGVENGLECGDEEPHDDGRDALTG